MSGKNLFKRITGHNTKQASKQASIDPINAVKDEPSIENQPLAITKNPSINQEGPSRATASIQKGKRQRIAAVASKVVKKTHLKDLAKLFHHHETQLEGSTFASAPVPSHNNSSDDTSPYAELLPLSESELGSSLSSSLSSTKTFDFINQNNIAPVLRARTTPLPLPQIYRPKTRRDPFFGGHRLDQEREVLRNTSAFTFATVHPSNETAQISVSTSSDGSASKSAGAVSASKDSYPDVPVTEKSDQEVGQFTISFDEGDDTVIGPDHGVPMDDDELSDDELSDAESDEELYAWPAPPIPPRSLRRPSRPWFLSSSPTPSAFASPSPAAVEDAEASTTKSQHGVSDQIVSASYDPMDSLGETSSAGAESVLDEEDTIEVSQHFGFQQTSEQASHDANQDASQHALSTPADHALSDTNPLHELNDKRGTDTIDAAPAQLSQSQPIDTELQVADIAKLATAAAPEKRSRFKSFFQKDFRDPNEPAAQHYVADTDQRQSAVASSSQDLEPLSRTTSVLGQTKRHVRSRLSKASSVFQLPRDAVKTPAHEQSQLPPLGRFPVSPIATRVSRHGGVLEQSKQLGASKRSRFASFFQQQEQQPQNVAAQTQEQHKHVELNMTSDGYPGMFNKNGMLIDVPTQAVLDRLSQVQAPRQDQRKYHSGLQSDHDRARFANAATYDQPISVDAVSLSLERFSDTASHMELGGGDRLFSPRSTHDGDLLTPNKLGALSKVPVYAHPIGTRNQHVRPSHDDAALVKQRPGSPFVHGKVGRKLVYPAPPADFDPDESMIANASSPQQPDSLNDDLSAYMLNIPARVATVDEPLHGAMSTGHLASAQYAHDDRAFQERYSFGTYVGKGTAPMYPRSNEQHISGQYGYGGDLVQDGAARRSHLVYDQFDQRWQDPRDFVGAKAIDSPDRALRDAMGSSVLYTYSSDESFTNGIEEPAGVHFPAEPRTDASTNAHTLFEMRNDNGELVHWYWGTCPDLMALDGRYLHVAYTPPSTPKNKLVPASQWLQTEAGLLLYPAVRLEEESWQTVNESDPVAIDWTIRPRLTFDVNKAAPLETPEVAGNDDTSDGDMAAEALEYGYENSPSVPAELSLEDRRDILREIERETEREDRLGFLFLHRKVYGQRSRALWPDQPSKQVQIDGLNMSSNDGQMQAQDDFLCAKNEALYKKFHRMVILAELEGDFAIFEDSAEQTADFLRKYRLIPAPEIEDFLAGNEEQHQPVPFLEEQHMQDTLLQWKGNRQNPKWYQLHRTGLPAANIWVSRRGSVYMLEALRVPRRVPGKEDPQIDELEARGVEVETVPDAELDGWNEMRGQCCDINKAWFEAHPMPVLSFQKEHPDRSGRSAEDDDPNSQPGGQSDFDVKGIHRGQAVSETGQTTSDLIDLTYEGSGDASKCTEAVRGLPADSRIMIDDDETQDFSWSTVSSGGVTTTDEPLAQSQTAELPSEDEKLPIPSPHPATMDGTDVADESTEQGAAFPAGETSKPQGFDIANAPSSEEATDFLSFYEATRRPAPAAAAAVVPLSAVPARLQAPARRASLPVLPANHPTRAAVIRRLEAWKAQRRAVLAASRASSRDKDFDTSQV